MPVNGITGRRRSLLPLALAIVCASCSSTPKREALPPDPAVITDADERPGIRRAAIEGARDAFATGRSDEAVREALKSVAWSRSTLASLRIDALEALFADEANLEDTRAMLGLMIPTESAWSEWDALRFMGEQAVTRGWTDLAPAFIASLARTQLHIAVRERPEYRTLVELIGEDAIPQRVFDVFAGVGDESLRRERDRLAAWSLLRELDPDGVRTGEQLRTLTEGQAGDDPLLASLRRGADELGVVAGSGEELEWLKRLSAPEHADFWTTASGVVRVLDSEQRVGLALRHLPALVWSSRHEPQWLATTREELVAHIDARLDGRPTYLRGSSRTSGQRELFRRVRDALRWADLMVIAVTLEALEDEGLTSELFRQADLDHDDTSTEHGGIITQEDSSPIFYATHYPPRPAHRFRDNRFVASPEMIGESADALLHYHFHASRHNHRSYAGPSVTDLDYAQLYARCALVLTFVDEDTLAVDYFQPDRTTVDLGVIERP